MPAGTEVVGSDVMVGAGRKVAEVIGVVMVKVRGFEGPVAVETETDAVPEDAVSVGRIAAVTCVVLANVVTRGIPFQFTVVAPFTKFVPFTVRVIPRELQAGVDADEVVDAESEVIVGATIGNEIALDVAPPVAGVETATCAVPTAAISAAVIAAVSCVAPR